ncbi:MAG TPA: WD40 repeat domain-containing protein, partial [Planctomycetota bacterium]|nr:WD40 repeat domain-containing protein [Planctomycetota bacterium]
KQLRSRVAHLGFASALALDPTGSAAATAGADGVIKLWNLADLSERLTLQGHQREVGSLVFHPTRPILASQSFDGTVRLWNVGAESLDTAPLATLHVTNTAAAQQVLFSPDGATLACLTDGNLDLWDLRDRVDATPAAWKDLRLSQSRLLYTLDDAVVLRGERGLLTLNPSDSAPRSQAVPDLVSAFLPAGDVSHPICITQTGLIGPPDKLAPLAPADAGKVTGGAHLGAFVLINRSGRFFSADTAQPRWSFTEIHGDADSTGLALATDGRFFSWTADHHMAFSTPPGPPETFEVNHLAQAYPQKIFQAAWLPGAGGVVLRTGGADLPIVNTDGEPAGAIVGHLAPVRAMALDPTGRFLATGDASGQLRLTDLTDLTGSPFGPPLPAPAVGLLFDPAGDFLFCTLETGQLIRYRLPRADPHFDIFELRDRVRDELGIEPTGFAAGPERNPLTPSPVTPPPAVPPPPGGQP